MKKIIGISLTFLAVVIASGVIFYIYWPFAKGFINEKRMVGDAAMHLANILAIRRDHPFPILAWKSEWAGYPLIEGYPWLHYYLIQPVLSFFQSPGLAMDYYSAVFLLVYYVLSFLLLFKVSRNVFLSLLFGLVLIYGADSQMPFSVNAFIVFTASQFFLPLILLITIYARERNSPKLFILSAIVLSIAFYAHGAMTGMIIVPILLPFLLLNKKEKIGKESSIRTIRYFILFALLSSIQIYQFISYSAQGYLRGVKPFPLDIIPGRLASLFSWVNPVLLPLLAIFLLLFIIAIVKKHLAHLKPYFLSLLIILFIFTLMVFNITSMNLVLLAERVLWAISLTFLLLFGKVVEALSGKSLKRTLPVGLAALAATGVYLYFTLIVKPPHLIPNTLIAFDPYLYQQSTIDAMNEPPTGVEYDNKYAPIDIYKELPWANNFDNFRTDGISYNIYSRWNIRASTPRYKGRFPAAKGLPLDWSGLTTAAQYGRLGEAGTFDSSQWAINQSLFFFDWYGIRHFEIAEDDLELADFLRKEPYIASTIQNVDLIYYSVDEKYIGPIYAPTEVKTMAVVSPQKQYDNFVRTLSYSTFTSQRIIPLYLGSSLSSLNRSSLKYFDAIFLYGYKKSIFAPNIWETLDDYVKNGGKLIIETGQKVGETANPRLPEVFPVKATTMEVIQKAWNAETVDNELTKGIEKRDFNPLKTKYLPFALSEAKPESVKSWAQPVLAKDGNVVMAYGQLEKGSVVWSGLNLPFHAIDNRNVSETVIFANILNWFFPDKAGPIKNFQVSHPNSESISVKSDEGKGVLIKENYSSGWSAKLNGKAAKIYKAGLFEMYIPFTSRGTNEVKLNYHGVPLHWLLFGISFATFIGVLAFLFFNVNPLLWVNKLYKSKKKSDEEEY